MDFLESLGDYLPIDEITALSEAQKKAPTHALLLNSDKISEEDFLSTFPHVRPHPFVPHAFLYDKEEYEFGKSLLYAAGALSIQEPSAMMPVYFLSPKPGDLVLDLCASPGGKSVQASLSLEGQGVVLANDLSYQRAKNLSQNIERLGLGNIVVSANDFGTLGSIFNKRFDKIILDAPCSGSAMFRKDPAEKADWSLGKVESCARRQLELLQIAYPLLKDGGILSYSTCSFSYKEDEGVILDFLKKHPEARFLDLPADHRFYHSPALPEAVHLFPNRFEGEGQFVALLQKPGASLKNKPTIVTDKKYQDFLSFFGLNSRSNEAFGGQFYSLSEHFDAVSLHVLRYGVKLFDLDAPFIPDHNLSHFLGQDYAIPLNEAQARLYLHGDSFPLNGGAGFQVVSYQGLNLGFVKIVKGLAKNHYPKGLRINI